MTAVDLDAARERLAAALPESLGPVGLRQRAVPVLGVPDRVTGYGNRLLDALLPVVQAMVAEGAAKELRAAADEMVKDGRPDLTTVDQVQAVNDAAQWLDARADALDPS